MNQHNAVVGFLILTQRNMLSASTTSAKRLNVLLARCSGDKLVTTKTGTYFNPANFRKDVWEKAGKACGITDKVPYSMRHSFAAWALTLRIDPNRLVRLMGHGSKQ